MMEFGKSLKLAREAKGLSVAQMVEETHLAPTTISELENEDFSHIAAPIYGRGFVKLYCEAVGLDPKPFVNEFMELFSGNHDAAIRERPVAVTEPEPEEGEEETSPIEVAEPEEEKTPAAVAEPEAKPTDLFSFDEAVSSEPPIANPFGERDSLFATAPALPAEQPPVQTQDQPPQEADEHAFSRYAAPIRQRPPIPPSVWRLGVLALGALVILTLIVLGVRALYRATSTKPTAQGASVSAVSATPTVPAETKTAAKPAVKATTNDVKTKRSPQPIPSLYVD